MQTMIPSDDKPFSPGVLHRGDLLFSRISLGTGLISIAPLVYFIVQALQQPENGLIFWERLALAVLFGLLAVLGWQSSSGGFIWRAGNPVLSIAVGVQIAMIALSALVKDVGAPAALICLIYTFMVGFLSTSFRRTELMVMAGVFSAMAAYFVSAFSPMHQLNLPALEIYFLSLLGLLVIVYLAMLAMKLVVATISLKLISSALAIALLPLFIFSGLQVQFTRNALLNESTGSLRLAAIQTANKIDEFINHNQSLVTLNSTLPEFSEYLALSEGERPTSSESLNARIITGKLEETISSSFLESIAILDRNGKNVFDTRTEWVGRSERYFDYFKIPFTLPKSYASPVLFTSDGASYIVFSSAIRSTDNRAVGVLRIQYRGDVLQKTIEANRGLLGYTSYPVLIDDNGLRIGDGSGDYLVNQPVAPLTGLRKNELIAANRLPAGFQESPLAPNENLHQAILSEAEQPFFTFKSPGEDDALEKAGVVVRLRLSPWNLVYIQQMDTFQALIQRQTQITTLLAVIIACIVSIAAALLSRLFSKGILKLTAAAEQITMGNFSVSVDTGGGDEIGILGKAFNLMTSQVRTLIDELEARVDARTAELSQQNEILLYRSQQLRTVSDVARSITSTLDLETLLNQVSVLVSHRFGFYHAGIFLVDEKKEFAYLRATNSEGGRNMLARQHKLKVGEVGIVGYVCEKGEARIATDVGADAVFFDNPDLPLTRSEMALPLKRAGEVIGALDVQSEKPNAFTEEDVELFSVLADQVAIAIVNNRLYAATNTALEEIQELHRRYLRNEWGQEIERRQNLSYRYTSQGINPLDTPLQPEVEQVFQTGEIYIQNANGGNGAETPMTLAVPINLRGETIGAIHLQEQGQQEYLWNQEEVSSIQAVADQVALALENARLFEHTTRRAERERKVLEITSKIRATNDFQTMLQIAVEELQQALHASRVQVILQQTGEGSPAETPGEKESKADRDG